MGSESMLQEILWDTKIGWWKVDMARRVLLLSDYLCKTIGTEESEIGYDRFLQSVGEPFRASLKSLMSTDASLFSAEQIFSLCGPRGEVWFRWKVLRRETAADKGLVVSGYAQEISEREALPVDLCSIERMNTLLYRLNNISHTLLSFLHIGSIDEAINKVLTDVLKIFRGSRTYIAEFDWDNRRHIYTYEVTDKGVESGRIGSIDFRWTKPPGGSSSSKKGVLLLFPVWTTFLPGQGTSMIFWLHKISVRCLCCR